MVLSEQQIRTFDTFGYLMMPARLYDEIFPPFARAVTEQG